MPVGTKATVKGIDPDRLRELGATILLGNTYHLHFRPGAELIEELGGLHRFMGWDGPILTDSGGFQVFSLRDTILAADDDGVTFRSVYDGQPARFTPELAADVQRRLGSDVAMCLDVCPPAGVRARRARDARSAATTRSGRSASSRPRAPRASSSSGSRRAGSTRSSAAARSRRSRALGFDGYALGGLSVGEERAAMLETVAWAAPLLPADRPRYFMGIGDPAGILEVVERGIDMFDCVLPTRLGRTGSALTLGGAPEPPKRPLRARRAARSTRSARARPAAASRRAYLRHLVNQQELLGLILLSEHNVRFLLDLTAGRARRDRAR